MSAIISPAGDSTHAGSNRNSATRSLSTRVRPSPTTPTSPQRAASTSNRHSRQTSNTRPIEDILPQNDLENSNIASNSKRNTSRDRPPPTRGPDSSRPHRRGSTKSNQNAQVSSTEVAATSATQNTGTTPASHAAVEARPSAGKHSRSRTTIPTQSGKWILGKTIGAGSMGKVKLARKEDGSEQVACKIIPRGSTEESHHSRVDKERADQSKEIRTAREAAIVTLLNHPHICGLRDVVRTNYHWYMLFEFVNGGQMLDYIISHGKLKEKQARKFSRQIGSALDYCHRNSIVHRDLKIENILISKAGDIKIIDFGLSNLFAPRGHLKTFCGSLYFAAPELLQARAYTGPEVDIWSFGIVLYVLVCGKVPFDDQSMPALHAKIKKGLVDYPSWLSHECKHILSRMLVTDPKQRATMHEVMTHPWMNKGYPGPPENYLPQREPLTLPLDQEVINAMTGFNFGPPETIKAHLTRTIESEEYQHAIRMYQKERDLSFPIKDVEKRRGFGFDFYKRRNSGNSRDTLSGPSSEGLQLGTDPLNAFSPLISIYYLVKEKQDRDRLDVQPTNASAAKEREKEQVADLAPPQAAHTNTAAYEMPGEQATGGRSRPRARTQGEDESSEANKHAPLSPSTPQYASDTHSDAIPKKESTAAGILRRFSTRRKRDPERLEKDRSHPPVVHVHSPADSSATPRKSFSIRRSRRDRDELDGSLLRSGSSYPNQAQHSDLLSPPLSARDQDRSRRRTLARSTSVNSADLRRRGSKPIHKEPPPTSGSDQSAINEKPSEDLRSASSSKPGSVRAKSLGHARRESIRQRRLRREEAREADVPEETDQEMAEGSGISTDQLDESDLAKPVFLKGLFSVQTTSGKTVPEIRADVKRVLRRLGIDYIEIRGGFKCRHSPSIDLNKVTDLPGSPVHPSGHKRRFSLGGLMTGDRDRDETRDMDRPPITPRTPGRGTMDRSYTNSEASIDSMPRDATQGYTARRVPGETSTQVQSDLGGSMVLEFEIFIVKIPLLSLHGIHFKRIAGNTWQYKNMADQILRELRL